MPLLYSIKAKSYTKSSAAKMHHPASLERKAADGRRRLTSRGKQWCSIRLTYQKSIKHQLSEISLISRISYLTSNHICNDKKYQQPKNPERTKHRRLHDLVTRSNKVLAMKISSSNVQQCQNAAPIIQQCKSEKDDNNATVVPISIDDALRRRHLTLHHLTLTPVGSTLLNLIFFFSLKK